MRTTDRSWQSMRARRVIDVTPAPLWQRFFRSGVKALLWVAAIPLLMVLGVSLLLVVLGVTGAILVLGYVRYWRAEHAYRTGATRWDG